MKAFVVIVMIKHQESRGVVVMAAVMTLVITKNQRISAVLNLLNVVMSSVVDVDNDCCRLLVEDDDDSTEL